MELWGHCVINEYKKIGGRMKNKYQKIYININVHIIIRIELNNLCMQYNVNISMSTSVVYQAFWAAFSSCLF